MFTLTFTDPACRDVRETGGKAKSLADMTANELPVAPGFAVTAEAYRHFLGPTGLGETIGGLLADPLDPHDLAALERTGNALMEAVRQTAIPQDLAEAVRAAYAELCTTTGLDDVSVAVRSSATSEDSAGASFAGEFETWVDIHGAEDVLAHILKCYESVFAPRVLGYAIEQELDPRTIEMAVVVQKVVRARAAGVMFTLSPTSGDRSKIVVEASWGLGLAVVGGEVTPDRFLVDKIGLEIAERTPGDKRIEYRTGAAPTPVEEARHRTLCLDDAEVTALAKLGKRLERIHGSAQDIEFAVDEELPEGSNLILLQCRPETVWSGAERKPAFDASAGMMSWITGSISGGTATAAGHTHDLAHKHSA
ncbi:PEP/pyruvate-binding domain-containing protein [Sinomonas flava]|uniref:Phosphoenolpyruvate synthase n=1 Tax=Sinomonas flava TaxID=496857 RepID=A0ABN3C2F9_9MICC